MAAHHPPRAAPLPHHHQRFHHHHNQQQQQQQQSSQPPSQQPPVFAPRLRQPPLHLQHARANRSTPGLDADDVAWIRYFFDLGTSDAGATAAGGGSPPPPKMAASQPASLGSIDSFDSLASFDDVESPMSNSSPLGSPFAVKRRAASQPEMPQDERPRTPENPALDDMGSVAGAKRRKSFSDADNVFMEGRWRPDEVAVLMHVAHELIKQDLRVIGDVTYSAGINRPRRAIEKQLKRMLKYEKWVNRDWKSVRAQIAGMISSGRVAPLTEAQRRRVQEACRGV